MDSHGQRSTTSTGLSSSVSKSVPKGSGKLEIQDEAEVKQTIKDIRSGSLGWCLLSYDQSGSNLVLLGKGAGDASELVQSLNDSIVAYGLIRKTEQIDQTSASKFAFIKFQGSNIPVMLKARLGTHSGVVTSLLSVSDGVFKVLLELFVFTFFFFFKFLIAIPRHNRCNFNQRNFR